MKKNTVIWKNVDIMEKKMRLWKTCRDREKYMYRQWKKYSEKIDIVEKQCKNIYINNGKQFRDSGKKIQ